MKLKMMMAGLLVATATANSAVAQELLTGDTRLSCEALLCLRSPTKPGECAPGLNRYYSIFFPLDPAKTIRERMKFLDLCPVQK